VSTVSKYEVSVIVLTFNHQKFILDTLGSIESQDFDSIQVVIGDDASSDNTTSIIDDFSRESRFDYVKLFNDKNQGITRNFNNCLRACTGKYIFLLGGDDLYLEGKIKLQYEYMEQDPDIAISCHDAYVFDSCTGKTLLKYSDLFKIKDVSVNSLIVSGTFFTGCTPAIRRFENMPECYDQIKSASDWLWYIELLIKSGGRIGYIDSVLSRYRRHSHNITSNKNHVTAYSETRDSLIYVIENYPEFKSVAIGALGERQFAFFLKGLLAYHWCWAVRLLMVSFKNNPFAFFSFLKLRCNALSFRLKRLWL